MKECPKCHYPLSPPLESYSERGREMRKDGWGVLRDKHGSKIGLTNEVSIVLFSIIGISFFLWLLYTIII